MPISARGLAPLKSPLILITDYYKNIMISVILQWNHVRFDPHERHTNEGSVLPDHDEAIDADVVHVGLDRIVWGHGDGLVDLRRKNCKNRVL